jgi:hypothetical protein
VIGEAVAIALIRLIAGALERRLSR